MLKPSGTYHPAVPIDSPLFLLAFLPVLLVLHAVCPRVLREGLLLAASLLFYAISSTATLPFFAASMLGNLILGLIIERAAGALRARLTALGVVLNLALLAWSKYLGFLAGTIPGLEFVKTMAPDAMPLGVSFFTFAAVAYLVDIGRGSAQAEKNPVRFCLFFSFFPKIAAGPIARHKDMAAGPQTPGLEDVRAGFARISIGLAKKVFIAGTLAPMADAAFGERAGNLDLGTAWLGLVSYSLQLYFDFAGYTDMAVGLGRVFGYRLPENFNYPYISQSVREFWRRWHMTLSLWFRDYLYIPLGGGRVAPWKIQRNLLVVFTLCGLWHGASWSFVIWGFWHGVFLSLERTSLGRLLDRLPRVFRHTYALFAVMLGWVFFRAPDLSHAWEYFRALAGMNPGGFGYTWMMRINHAYMLMLILAIAGAAQILPWLGSRLGGAQNGAALGTIRAAALSLLPPALLALSIMQLAAGTYSPFIYAQF